MTFSGNIVDKKIRQLPCLVCNARRGIVAHHVTSRGAGGEDTNDNLMPLCIKCHREIHDRGLMQMIREYPQIRLWLKAAGRYDIINKFKYMEKMSENPFL